MEIASNLGLFVRSFFLTLVGGASSSEAPIPSIVPFEMTINILDPENGDCLQSLTFCEILLPHVSRGCLLIGGTHSLHHLLKPVHQSSTLFSLLFMAINFDDTTIKHSIYTSKVPFQSTERACVGFFQFKIRCKKMT